MCPSAGTFFFFSNPYLQNEALKTVDGKVSFGRRFGTSLVRGDGVMDFIGQRFLQGYIIVVVMRHALSAFQAVREVLVLGH